MGIMMHPPRGRSEKIINGWMFVRYLLMDTANGKYYFPDSSFDCSIFEDNRPSTMSLSILVCIEMFNTFNALGENQSLLVNPPWANIWVVLAVILSILLHCMILYIQ